MPGINEARILIVATDGFEESELFGPREILQRRGAEVVLASLKMDPIQATVHDDPGKTIRPDLIVDEVNATGQVFVSHTRLDGRYVIRLAIGNLHTTEHHVRHAWSLLCTLSRRSR